MTSDPINTTRDDGAACAACGADAVGVAAITERDGAVHPHPLCGRCFNDAVTECPNCDRMIWQRDGVRVFVSPTLYCRVCSDSQLLALAKIPIHDEVRR